MREDTPLLAWDDAAVVARGRALYAAQCAACHGTNGEGQATANDPVSSAPLAPPHDASWHTWQHPDFALIQLTKAGASTVACRALDQNAMPRFEQALSDRQIVDVLSYIKSTWPAEIRAEQDEINRLYRSHNAAVLDLLDLEDS
jgi:mono/diheme cytochrome c family protein